MKKPRCKGTVSGEFVKRYILKLCFKTHNKCEKASPNEGRRLFTDILIMY